MKDKKTTKKENTEEEKTEDKLEEGINSKDEKKSTVNAKHNDVKTTEAKKTDDSKVDETLPKEDKTNEENKENKTNEEQEEPSKPPVNENQIKWFVISLATVIIVMVVVVIMASGSKNIEYIGLNFEKRKFNDFFIYTGHIVGLNVNADPINFQLNLRNNPVTNDVPIERNIIIKDKNRPIYVALNMSSGIHECGSVPLVALGQFIAGMGYEHITTATTEESAEELDLLHSNCDNNSGSTVLLITASNQTEIVVNDGNSDCYEIRVNNCELGKALEKAELSILSELSGVPL